MRTGQFTLLIGLISWSLLGTACSSAPASAADEASALPDVKSKDIVSKFSQDTEGATDDASEAATDAQSEPADAVDATGDDAADDSPDTSSAAEDSSTAMDVQCMPACGIHLCGDDGCGGSCGTCASPTICSVGKCITDPKLGCAGLSLPPNWAGTFSGDMTFSILGLIPTQTTSKGKLAFAIKCLNSKFLVNGTMSGTASKLNPFTLTISGTYDPTTKKMDATMSAGDVTVFLVVEYFFGGTIEGTLDATDTFAGTWVMATTSMKLLGSATAGQIVPLTGNGTWTATGGP